MSIEQFIELVRNMRTAQKAYFGNGRKQSDLIESKQLEKRVDQALKGEIIFPVLEETDGPLGEGTQIGMFLEDDNEAN